jgi:lysophospholipase L1-like esterase
MSGFGILDNNRPTIDDIADVLQASNGTTDIARAIEALRRTVAAKNRPIVVGGVGDSIIQNHYGSVDSAGLAGVHRSIQLGGAWLHWACGLLDGMCIPDVYALEGNSGLKTWEIIAALKAPNATIPYGVSETIAVGLAARRPDIAIDMSGTNDVTYYNGLSDAQGPAKSAAFRQQIWAYIRSLGIQPMAMSMLPRDDALTAQSAIYNAAYKAAADADGVPWIDVYTPCAQASGLWKAGYTYRVGANDALGLHPWLQGTTKGVAPAVANALRELCSPAKIPRLVAGGYLDNEANFATDNRFYYGQPVDGRFPTTQFAVRIDGDANCAVSIAANTIDSAGGNTLETTKATGAAASYSDTLSSTGYAVTPGREYITILDVQFEYTGSVYSNMTVQVVNQENRALTEAYIENRNFTAPTKMSVYRLTLRYKAPIGTTSIKLMTAVNRLAGGVAGGQDIIRIANVSHLRVA